LFICAGEKAEGRLPLLENAAQLNTPFRGIPNEVENRFAIYPRSNVCIGIVADSNRSS
jgi:hypothetical protein